MPENDQGPMWKAGEQDNAGLEEYSSEELEKQYEYWYSRGFSGEAMRRYREVVRRDGES